MKIITNDNVLIVKGKDKGKKAKVEKVFPIQQKVVVTGLNKCKKHLKPSKKNPQGGIINKTMPISISNVRIICNVCNKASKVAYRLDDKSKIRICKKCKQSLDK